MFKNRLLSTTRITALGEYESPNVCFISPDEDDPDGGEGQSQTEDDVEDVEDGPEDGDEEDGADAAAEAEDGEEAGEGETEDRAPVRREGAPRRGASEVIREEKRARKEATAKVEEVTRRAEAAERRAEAAERAANERRTTENAAAERERLALMTEDERVSYYREQDKAEHRREMDGVRFQVWDSTDRAEFRELCREDPLVARVKDKVEAEYTRLKGLGRPVEREIIANQEIAKMMRNQRQAAGTRQRNRGAESVRRETARPVRARGDVAPARSRRGQEDTPEARRRRLEDVII